MSQRLSRAVARVLPKRLVGAAVRAVYPRAEPELRHLDEFVPVGGTAVDVGAWFGPWTARLLRRADRVVAVEADPELAALLGRTFPAVRVVAAAASDRDGMATLWSPPAGAIVGLSTLEREAGGGAKVPTVALDGLGLADVRFLKFDIEGHELAALRGAEGLVRGDLPVLLLELEARHGTLDPVVDLLDSWGYAGFVRSGGRWQSLSGFDLASHQAAHAAHLTRSFPSRVLFPGTGYLNSVLFRHHSRAR
ncbi:FkbM family methyltransferase [Actinocorallia sp. API 0066]|uniref:FkbM family methyltransferase n=1 Tax=Actinocorallia sp. API 0066 TaxID=2896846 RepID=UPI001E5AF561|nr:FkbM family methyltransferase [Actinocorallia sp. API 0066]MCD0451252.1 FkbM family methyltransferase [Actinocorallia sp. API 0066]